ncbi:hypothetical protein DFH07DRAFT_916200 [Mycena maculata]|uniref:DUF7779 domain-containing protein n=1 Tax=Mycena maculata TaxID=230809 RepID=A0AAD7JJP6_9AGAR|nr:hypothetical protein DFH07DRAFT_916200 [Mycena maculata]
MTSDSQLYSQLLLPKRLGYPLFHPQPCDDLPESTREIGIMIGDVGIVAPDGCFDPIFNILQPPDHPANRFGVPRDFQQVNILPDEIRVLPGYHPAGSVISNVTVNGKIFNEEGSLENNVFLPNGAGAAIEVTTNSKQMAVLLLPDGASTCDLRAKHVFRDYALRHGRSWYEFVNGDLRRMVRLGDLYLVSGVTKTTKWGITAAESHSRDEKVLRTAQFDAVASSWQSEDSGLSVDFGPHRSPGEESWGQNQTVFIRGFKVALAPPCNPPDGDVSDDEELREDHVYHPSDVINKYLLDSDPSTIIAVTHDDEWASTLDEDEEDIPEDQELIRRHKFKAGRSCLPAAQAFELSKNCMNLGPGGDTDLPEAFQDLGNLLTERYPALEPSLLTGRAAIKMVEDENKELVRHTPHESAGFSGYTLEGLKESVALRPDHVADGPVPGVFQSINNCPPPSRIFHGRQNILDKMHEYFDEDLGKQHIFMLHGLGGAGKTQIALKFIHDSSLFCDVFMVDASTANTIDTGLKNIAVMKNSGDTTQDVLRWLASHHNNWLIFFNNADDPKINLNSYFPQCSHGSILITSRIPGCCVYAGSHSLVSDMQEADAVELLLTSATQEKTLSNKETAAEIVKVLCYLPLAIIQAGAFIANSGVFISYLELYTQKRAWLLNKTQAQSHDDYAWSVYTTWEISFERISPTAARFLQLCSFLHYQGISEEMFSHASTYGFPSAGPSKEELEKPLEFLSEFLGPTGIWDSLRFTDVITELRAYSLINFNTETQLFSIHPLVHSWIQSTLADLNVYQPSMVAIMGMSIATMTYEYLQLASPWLLPHVNVLVQDKMHVTPDFNYEYGSIYYYSGRPKDAAALESLVLEKRWKIPGEDHPETLGAMRCLAAAYLRLGKFKEAEALEVVVLEKQRKTLGEDHPGTLCTMGNLAVAYRELGQLQKAEQLGVVILEKQIKIHGEDHPDTLVAMGNLANTYHELGRLKEAEELKFVVLEKQRQVLVEDHPDTIHTMGNLAWSYHKLDQLDKTEELSKNKGRDYHPHP